MGRGGEWEGEEDGKVKGQQKAPTPRSGKQDVDLDIHTERYLHTYVQ